MSASEVATVTLRTHTVANLTGDRRTYDNVVDRQLLEALHRSFVEHGACVERDLVTARNHDRLGEHAAQYALRQRFDDVAALNDRRHGHTITGFAVHFRDHEILGNVDKTTRQVTRVGGLKCRIGQTFTSTMRRDEVLQYVEAFAEVGCNR